MAKPEWGTKRLCTSCGARFYDLNKDPIECPKCGAIHDPDQGTRLKRSRNTPAEAPAKAKPAEKKDDEIEVEDDDADDVLEDASDLGDDDEDLDEIVEGVEPDPDKEKDGD